MSVLPRGVSPRLVYRCRVGATPRCAVSARPDDGRPAPPCRCCPAVSRLGSSIAAVSVLPGGESSRLVQTTVVYRDGAADGENERVGEDVDGREATMSVDDEQVADQLLHR